MCAEKTAIGAAATAGYRPGDIDAIGITRLAVRRLPAVAVRVAHPRGRAYRRDDGDDRRRDAAADLLPDTWNLPGMKSGFVAVAGRPNVGKSTLVNALTGAKVAIVSDKPHTTRHRIRGIYTTDDAQLVLVDLPGWQRPIDTLTERMQEPRRRDDDRATSTSCCSSSTHASGSAPATGSSRAGSSRSACRSSSSSTRSTG